VGNDRRGVIKLLPEDNPDDEYQCWECDVCGGNIKRNYEDKYLYECDNSDWSFQIKKPDNKK
jgi:ligand-binding sensor protein